MQEAEQSDREAEPVEVDLMQQPKHVELLEQVDGLRLQVEQLSNYLGQAQSQLEKYDAENQQLRSEKDKLERQLSDSSHKLFKVEGTSPDHQ